jgi:hypothetical protein
MQKIRHSTECDSFQTRLVTLFPYPGDYIINMADADDKNRGTHWVNLYIT